jgi:hypothetical protein
MFVHVTFSIRLLIANRTLKWFLPGMYNQMLLKVTSGLESFLAVWAYLVGLGLRCQKARRTQILKKQSRIFDFSLDCIFEFFQMLSQHMAFHGGFSTKKCPTKVTSKRFFPGVSHDVIFEVISSPGHMGTIWTLIVAIGSRT